MKCFNYFMLLFIGSIETRNVVAAMGETVLNNYLRKVVLDGREFKVEAVAGPEIGETSTGIYWLRTKRLLVDFPAGVLMLE